MGGKHGLCCCQWCCLFCRECDNPNAWNILDSSGELVGVEHWMYASQEFVDIAMVGDCTGGLYPPVECSSYDIDPLSADELPATVTEASDINGIEFGVGAFGCETLPFAVCSFDDLVRSLLADGDDFQIDTPEGNCCLAYAGVPQVRYLCHERPCEGCLPIKEFGLDTFVYLCTSNNGVRIIAVGIAEFLSGTGTWIGAKIVGSGRQICDTIEETIDLVPCGDESEYNPPCLSLSQIIIRLRAGVH